MMIFNRSMGCLKVLTAIALLALSFALAQAASLPDVTVGAINGRPTILVGGAPISMAGYSPMTWSRIHTERAVPRFAQHGMGYYLCNIPSTPGDFWGTVHWVGDEISAEPLVEVEPTQHHYGIIDGAVEFILEQDPDAYIMIRFGIHEPASWKTLHPDEYFLAEDGSRQGAPSLASERYWQAAAAFSAAVVEYCESRPWAERVIGYANFHHTEGTHAPAIAGWLYDHSEPMTARWRRFLEERYATIDALRAAWNDPDIASFAAVNVPTDPLRGPAPDVANRLYWQAPSGNQPLRDYLELQRDLWHERFGQLSAAMHGAARRQVVILHDALKQTMLGWDIRPFFVMQESGGAPRIELMAASGHMEVARLFDLDGCDGLITPHDYQMRGMGGIFEPEGIADSAVLRGKLFLCEMDIRTDTGDRPEAYGSARDLAEFEAITWRNLATALTRGWWPYWMDLSADWFSDPAMAPVIARQIEVLNESLHWPHETVPGIAVILDDRAVLETSGDGAFHNQAILEQIRTTLSRCGVPYRVYLLEDLALDNFPEHRVFYFPNLFKADETTMATLREKVLGDGRLVVWGPGSGIADGEAGAADLTGFTFDPATTIPANYRRRVQITNFEHPITRTLDPATIFGSSLAYGPILFPSDGITLGRALTKQGQNLPGLAIEEMDGWTSVFTTALPLPADLWRNLARAAGAHVYSETNDILLADANVVALHSMKPGRKTISLPHSARVIDLISGRRVARRAREITFTLDAPGTRVFRIISTSTP